MVALSLPKAMEPCGVGRPHDQLVQLLNFQCRAEVAQLHQQLSELWCVVADLQASNEHVQRQMREFFQENAALERRLSIAGCSDRDACDEEEQFEPALPSLPASRPDAPLVLQVEKQEDQEGPRVDGISICASCVDGRPSTKVQWRIGRVSAQLYGAMGRALVSPEFDVGSLTELRLMVAPNVQGMLAPKGRRARDTHKKMVTEGPLNGCLMLKVPNASDESVEYYASMSEHRRGPFATNFSGQCLATHANFGVDWLQEKEGDGSLVVGVEIMAPADRDANGS